MPKIPLKYVGLVLLYSRFIKEITNVISFISELRQPNTWTIVSNQKKGGKMPKKTNEHRETMQRIAPPPPTPLRKTNENRRFISELTIVMSSIGGGLRSEEKQKDAKDTI